MSALELNEILDCIWARLPEGCRPEKPVLLANEEVGGYSQSKNTIYLGLPLSDGDSGFSLDSDDPAEWSVCVVELLEEVAHCLACKCPLQPSPAAELFWRKYGGSFAGSGHDAVFFQALILVAHAIDRDAELVIRAAAF